MPFELADGTTVQVDLPEVPTIRAAVPDTTWRVVPLGAQGPPGASGVTGYTHTQGSPSATWVITHNLGRYPSVAVVTGAGRMLPDATDSSLNSLTLTFATPQTGTAQLI